MNYAWKVLAVYNALHEYEIVFWMDTSVRIIAPLTDKPLHDLQVFPFRGEANNHYDAAYTYDSTYKRFGVTRREMSRRYTKFEEPYTFLVTALSCINISMMIMYSVSLTKIEIPNAGCFMYDQSILTVLVYRNFNITKDALCIASLHDSLAVKRSPTQCFNIQHCLNNRTSNLLSLSFLG